MWALSLWRTHRATTLFLILLSSWVLTSAQRLSAQIVSPRKPFRHQQLTARSSTSKEKAADPPLLASFSQATLQQRSENRWKTDPQMPSFAPPPKSNRAPVNFNLLLPAVSAKFLSWMTSKNTNLNKYEIVRDRNLIGPATFAPASETNDQQMPDRFNDPQYLTRRIPGVGPIVERVMKESKAHPRLTRVLKSIQPQF